MESSPSEINSSDLFQCDVRDLYEIEIDTAFEPLYKINFEEIYFNFLLEIREKSEPREPFAMERGLDEKEAADFKETLLEQLNFIKNFLYLNLINKPFQGGKKFLIWYVDGVRKIEEISPLDPPEKNIDKLFKPFQEKLQKFDKENNRLREINTIKHHVFQVFWGKVRQDYPRIYKNYFLINKKIDHSPQVRRIIKKTVEPAVLMLKPPRDFERGILVSVNKLTLITKAFLKYRGCFSERASNILYEIFKKMDEDSEDLIALSDEFSIVCSLEARIFKEINKLSIDASMKIFKNLVFAGFLKELFIKVESNLLAIEKSINKIYKTTEDFCADANLRLAISVLYEKCNLWMFSMAIYSVLIILERFKHVNAQLIVGCQDKLFYLVLSFENQIQKYQFIDENFQSLIREELQSILDNLDKVVQRDLELFQVLNLLNKVQGCSIIFDERPPAQISLEFSNQLSLIPPINLDTRRP